MTEQTHWSDRNLQSAAASQPGAGIGPDASSSAKAVAAAASNGEGIEAEQVRLDTAMQRADELLVESMRRDEGRRRRRRRRSVLIVLITGALIMTAIVCVLLAALAGQGKNDAASDPTRRKSIGRPR